MRFGKSADEAATEPTRGGGGDFIRYLKDGDTTFRILQETEDWVYYWEHFQQGGYPFPCDTDNRSECPGCTSSNEKTKKASRKIAFNVLQSYDGTDYVNVFKIPSTLADKLKNRAARLGTITDRDYTITKYKGAGDKVDYDLEGGAQSNVDMSTVELKDIEAMLADQFNESWGDPSTARESQARNDENQKQAETKAKVEASDDPPTEASDDEIVVSEADLRKMEVRELRVLCVEQLDQLPPRKYETPDEIVDWMLAQQ